MDHVIHNSIVNFIWGIADDVLRDVYVRGKYRDVILPMTVIRRLDALLEPSKEKVLGMKTQLDGAGIANQHAALCQASGEAFYNVSPFTLRDLKNRAKQQQLKADFEAYLDGFSPNVQEILDKFKFRNQIPTLIEADILGHLIEKFLDGRINLSPKPVQDVDGNEQLPALDNHSMGTIFEELIRRFNEENNEEAGKHFTPRDAVKLMAELIFLPVKGDIGKKNCEYSEEHIRAICDLVVNPVETEKSKIFPNESFGYWKVTVDRPLRLAVDLSPARLERFERTCARANVGAKDFLPLPTLARRVAETLGAGPHLDFNAFTDAVEADADKHGFKLTAKRRKLLQSELCDTREDACPVIRKVYRPGKTKPDPMTGKFEVGRLKCEKDKLHPSHLTLHPSSVVEYEPDTALRDSEQVPLLEEGGPDGDGIGAFFRREVLPYTPDAWIDPGKTLVGYEISFTRHFYRPAPMRTLDEIKADNLCPGAGNRRAAGTDCRGG